MRLLRCAGVRFRCAFPTAILRPNWTEVHQTKTAQDYEPTPAPWPRADAARPTVGWVCDPTGPQSVTAWRPLGLCDLCLVLVHGALSCQRPYFPKRSWWGIGHRIETPWRYHDPWAANLPHRGRQFSMRHR